MSSTHHTSTPYGALVQEYQLERVRELSAARRANIVAIRNAKDAQAYRKTVRAKLKRAFGTMPRRVPLNAKVTGVVDRPTYTIEKIMFQSRPNFWMTANLYKPKASPDGRKQFPGVIVSCGHGGEGKALGNYQAVGSLLAHNGILAMVYDPIGQGERKQYLDQGKYTGPVYEHQIAGNQMSLVGEYFGTWRAWDGIVAMDYLLTRPEVDRRHLGITGNSGGGTLTTFISMLDDRITMAAASCLGSDYLINLENELPCDSEQNPPGVVANELNYADFFIAQAPRPTLILAAKEDFFDLRGLDVIHQDMQHVFGLMGKKDNARIYRADRPHGYWPDMRMAMCKFFCETVGYKHKCAEHGNAFETEETLRVTQTGQVADIKGTRRVHDFTLATARAMAKARKPVAKAKLPQVLGKLLTLPARKEVAHYRVLRLQPVQNVDKAVKFRWGIETEGDGHMLAILQGRLASYDRFIARIPATPKVSLYLPDISSDEDHAAGHVTIPKDGIALTLDTRGIGEMRSMVCDGYSDFFVPYDADFYHAAQHQMLSESYLGRRVHDVLVTLDLLASQGTREVHLTGRGLGAVIAAFASVIHPAVKQVTLKNAPRSFQEMVQTVYQKWPLSSLPWGVLAVTDLPEIYAHLRATRKLRIVEPWNAKREAGKAVK